MYWKVKATTTVQNLQLCYLLTHGNLPFGSRNRFTFERAGTAQLWHVTAGSDPYVLKQSSVLARWITA